MDNEPQFRLFCFDSFTGDIDKAELRTADGLTCLTGKPFEVLVYLAKNHERLVPVEELLETFWPEDFDATGSDPQNVHQAISRIRSSTSDSATNPRYIQTRRRRGFRFIAPVNFLTSPPAPREVPSITAGAPPPALPVTLQLEAKLFQSLRSRIIFVIIGLGIVSIALLFPVPVPRIISSTALTHSGFPKYAPLIVDGNYLYFTELALGQYRIVRYDRTTKQTSFVSTTVTNPYLCAYSPARRQFLIRSVIRGFDDYGPLFIQGMDDKPAEPLPVTAFDGSWSPSATSLVYARGGDVSLFDLASRTSKIIAHVNGYAWWPRWAPEGNRLRFTVSDGATQVTSLWEVGIDGSSLRQLFAPKDPWFHANSGSWVANGGYFLFQVGPLSDSNLWVVNGDLKAIIRDHNPSQLTSGPSFRGPTLGPDGKTIFVRSQVYRGEMKRINIKTGLQAAFPAQAVIDTVAYSSDGRSMVYCISDQEQSLWLSKADGSSPRLLVPPPLQSAFPQWSPKGNQIALVTRRPEEPWRITFISPNSGEVEQLNLTPTNTLHPTWSPDGTQLAFGTIPTINENVYLYTLDVATHHVSVIAKSEGLFTPSWSPDGRYIAALKADTHELMVLTLKTGQWESLTGSQFGYPVWSRDSKYLYSFQNGKGGPRFYQIEVTTKIIKEILYLPGFQLLDRWIGFDNDGSLLAARNIGIMEIFALKLDHSLLQ